MNFAAIHFTRRSVLVRLLGWCVVLAGVGPLVSASASAEALRRSDTIAIAEQLAGYKWRGTEKNVLHGKDSSGVLVNTPNGDLHAGLWSPSEENTGIPYKWGGFDNVATFSAGLLAGKAAGDLYSSEKRRLGGAAVSAHAVGLDCSGFISRCWKLPKKFGTATLPRLCNKLPKATDLLPGDILNVVGGHVVLFARWLDDAKERALVYEAEPFSKVKATEVAVAEMVSAGFQPLRLRGIKD